jgi:hypothetical protein
MAAASQDARRWYFYNRICCKGAEECAAVRADRGTFQDKASGLQAELIRTEVLLQGFKEQALDQVYTPNRPAAVQ